MSALLKIKGRIDPLRISDEDAKSLKALWLDTEGTPRNKLVDLGEWAGELRDIKSIDIEESREVLGGMEAREAEDKAHLKSLEDFKSLSPEQKVSKRWNEIVGGFKLRYRLQNSREASEELVKQAETLAIAHFVKFPQDTHVPSETFADLLNQ